MSRTPFSTLLAALIFAVAAPAMAQGTPATDTTAVPWAAKPVGTYDLVVAVPDHDIPVTLVIADSAQHLTGLITSTEDGVNHAVTVSVKGNDLTLVGDTPNGALTIVLQQRNKKITGVWKVEDQSGTLSGTMRPK